MREDRPGRVVVVEVKGVSKVWAQDLRGLWHVAERIGSDFLAGHVRCTGRLTLPLGPLLRAKPVGAL